MTACGFISPDEALAPVIVSDTVISVAGVSSLGPARLMLDKARRSPIHLARKSYILNERCAVAFAGDSRQIADFLLHAKSLIDYQEDHPRPLRALGDRAGEYAPGSIEVIGAYAVGNIGVNTVAPEHNIYRIPDFGLIATVGSGGQELRSTITDLINDMGRLGADPASASFNAAVALGQDRLTEELLGYSNNADWGGIFEFLYLDPLTRTWLRQGRTIYLFYQMIFESNFDEKTNQIDSIILYDPGPTVGKIMSVVNHKSLVSHYLLEDLLRPENNYEPYDPQRFWSSWVPEMICVTIVYGKSAGFGLKEQHWTHAHFGQDIDNEFHVRSDGIKFSLTYKSKQIDDLLNMCRASYQEMQSR